MLFFLCYKYLKVDLGISGEKSVHFKSVFDYKISILFSFPFYFPNDGAHHNKTTNKKKENIANAWQIKKKIRNLRGITLSKYLLEQVDLQYAKGCGSVVENLLKFWYLQVGQKITVQTPESHH